jgi:hypothetical protein
MQKRTHLGLDGSFFSCRETPEFYGISDEDKKTYFCKKYTPSLIHFFSCYKKLLTSNLTRPSEIL